MVGVSVAEDGAGVVPIFDWYIGSEGLGHVSFVSTILAERKGYVLTVLLVIQAVLGGRSAVVGTVVFSLLRGLFREGSCVLR